jgi:hypothetical protein
VTITREHKIYRTHFGWRCFGKRYDENDFVCEEECYRRIECLLQCDPIRAAIDVMERRVSTTAHVDGHVLKKQTLALRRR